jgi:DNA polymerase III sliding clamp (beta) subunit (PCNA family)
MFKAKIKASILKSIADIAGAMADEFILKSTPKEIEMTVVNLADTGLVHMKLGKDAFVEYGADEREFGIGLGVLSPVMKLATAGDDIGLEYDEKSGQMIVTIGNIVRKMTIIDPEHIKHRQMNLIELPGIATLKDPNEFLKGIRAAADVSDDVSIGVDKDGFLLYAEGNIDNVFLKIPKEQLASLTADKKYVSKFKNDALYPIMRLMAGEVTIWSGKDKPIRAIFGFADGKGICTFLLAPIIERDE